MKSTTQGDSRPIDVKLRQRDRAKGKGFNRTAVPASGVGLAAAPQKRRTLGDIAGTWKADKPVEDAFRAQGRPDRDLWR